MHALILALLLVCSPAHAAWIDDQSAAIAAINGAGGACSTPADGDVLNEGFLGTGYELTWAETVGANGVLDEDHTLTGSPPAGSCTEGLLSQITATSGGVTYAQWDNGSEIAASVDIYAELMISSTLPTNGDDITVIACLNGSSLSCDQLRFYLSAGAYYVYVDGTVDSAAVAFSAGAWHTVKVHHDLTRASSYLQVDGGAQTAYTGYDRNPRYIRTGIPDRLEADETADIQWGRVWLNTP